MLEGYAHPAEPLSPGESLQDLSKKELLARAKDLQIRGRSIMTKEELRRALEAE